MIPVEQHCELLHQIGDRLQAANPRDDHSQHIVDVLDEAGFRNAAVLLLEKATGRLIPQALSRHGQADDFLHRDKDYVISEGAGIDMGITGWVARTGKSLMLNDVTADSRYRAMRPDIRSELCVPLRLNKRWVGVLNVESPEAGVYEPSDQRLLETVGTQVALTLLTDRATQESIGRVHPVSGARSVGAMIPVCAGCRRVRNTSDQWTEYEQYFAEQFDFEFTHGMCRDCIDQDR